MFLVPNTAETHGAVSAIFLRSSWAMQPPTAICRFGRTSLTRLNRPMVPYMRSAAFSRTAQVLSTSRSRSLSLILVLGCRHVAIGLQHAGDALGIVHVHLAAERVHVEYALSTRPPASYRFHRLQFRGTLRLGHHVFIHNDRFYRRGSSCSGHVCHWLSAMSNYGFLERFPANVQIGWNPPSILVDRDT